MLARKLKKGDTIAVFSPSSPATVFAKSRFERAKAYLEGKGYKIHEGSLTGKIDIYRSGTIKERADELNELIRNPEIKCIMSAIGGMNSNSLLPFLDYESLIKNPKVIIGYSDVSALLLGIYAKTGLITYYGPALVASFGEFPPLVDYTYAYFENIVSEANELPYQLNTPPEWTDEMIDWNSQDRPKVCLKNSMITLSPGKASGRLIAGNLNTMQGIWNTEYMPQIRTGDILLIEDSLKDLATVERSFSLLKLSGVFDKIGGLILGKHELFKDFDSGRKHYDVLLEVIGDVNFPILADFDCSHTHPMLTIPIGCEVMLDADQQTVKLLSPFIEE